VPLWSVDKTDPREFVDWNSRREGYVDTPNKFVPVVTIPKTTRKPAAKESLLSIRGEERLGSLIAAAGTVWAVYVATVDYNSLWRMQIMPPGPVEVCLLGVLAWIHAKWRRSTKID
jgi:hypothetical protein